MGKLILKLGLLALITALIGLHEIFLPLDQYTFRVWEALALRGQPRSPNLPAGPFYPNQRIARKEVGDIAAYSSHQVVKDVVWETDAHGFRNRPSDCRNFPIVVAGDSFGIGTSLTQSDILSEQIAARTGQCTYNLSGRQFQDSFSLLRQYTLDPRWVILVVSERGFRDLQPLSPNAMGDLPLPVTVNAATPLWILGDRLAKPTFLQYRARHGLLQSLRRVVVPVKDELRDGSEPKMMFYFGRPQTYVVPGELDRIGRMMAGYQAALKTFGARFIVLPIPDKETVYPEMLGLPAAPPELSQVYRRLKKVGVPFVDLYHPYREAYRRGEIVYQLDDTHWNARGVAIAADILLRNLSESK